VVFVYPSETIACMNNFESFNNPLSFELKEKIAAGDEHAFQYLFQLYSKVLVQFAFSFVKTKDVAIELVDGVFVKLWKQKDQVSRIQNLKVYLYTAIKNASLNYLSQRAYNSIIEPFDYININVNDEQTPEQKLIHSEIQNEINAAIDELPPRCKIVFKLVRQDGLKYKEVAQVLNISTKTVDAQMVIAVKRISEKVKNYFDCFPVK
jgi:RNA polymerase sigma-70 factor (ECF subfamily)